MVTESYGNSVMTVATMFWPASKAKEILAVNLDPAVNLFYSDYNQNRYAALELRCLATGSAQIIDFVFATVYLNIY